MYFSVDISQQLFLTKSPLPKPVCVSGIKQNSPSYQLYHTILCLRVDSHQAPLLLKLFNPLPTAKTVYVSQRQPILTLEMTSAFFFQGDFPLPVHSVSALLPKVFQRHVPFLKLKLHFASESYPASKSSRVTGILS